MANGNSPKEVFDPMPGPIKENVANLLAVWEEHLVRSGGMSPVQAKFQVALSLIEIGKNVANQTFHLSQLPPIGEG